MIAEATMEMVKLSEDRDQMIERSKKVLTKVQTRYQTQLTTYEVQSKAAIQHIQQLKKEKQA